MGEIKAPSKPIIFHKEAHSPGAFFETFPHDLRSLKLWQEEMAGKYPALGVCCVFGRNSWNPASRQCDQLALEPEQSRWAYGADVAAMGRLDLCPGNVLIVHQGAKRGSPRWCPAHRQAALLHVRAAPGVSTARAAALQACWATVVTQGVGVGRDGD